ncbi:hypothetical protein ACFYST_28400 [Kitasatospora sp. NPDC004614]|uniref:hypothetical protein n=1 Tax=unclassified Kitasatospora TaxID=2633591 RepID=UPI0036C9209A
MTVPSIETARIWQRRLRNVEPGLTDHELDAVEARFGFRFAPDHRVFLAAGLPTGPRWPDWRHGDPEALREQLAWPVEGTLFDVRSSGFWYPRWGPRSEDASERERVARAALASVPQLVPLHGHRYLPPAPFGPGHPVLSVYQTDIIEYGHDLADWLRVEFTNMPGNRNARPVFTVPFWSYFVVGDPESTVTTPHDPTATTAAEAVEYLRMLALERLVGRQVYDDQLITAGLVADALGVDAPSLPRLARLPEKEHDQAVPLFEQVLAELRLSDSLPADDTDLPYERARWELVRWWLRLIVDGGLRASTGISVITHGGWAPLARPESLRPLIDLGPERLSPDALSRTDLARAAVTEARRLLAGPWPPPPYSPSEPSEPAAPAAPCS